MSLVLTVGPIRVDIPNGASLPELQRLLGHRDLSTTQVYLAVTGSGLEQTAMANPARALLRKPTPPPEVDRPTAK